MAFRTPTATPPSSTSSSQPEYPLVTSAHLQSWSLTRSDSTDSLDLPPADPSTAACTALPAITYDSRNDKAADQAKGPPNCVAEIFLPKPAISNVANVPAAEDAAGTPDHKGDASPKPKKMLRLSYNDELRLAAKQTREKSGKRNAAFERAEAIMKRRMLKQSAVCFRQQPDMFILRRRGFPAGSPYLSSRRAPEDSTRDPVANVTLTDLAESRDGWFQRRRLAAGLPKGTEKRAAPADETISPSSNVEVEHRLLPRARELLLYPLACLIAIVLMAVLVMLFASRSEPYASGVERKAAMCDTESCYQDAAFLSELLSWNIDDPCESFQPFVCRRWASQFHNASLTLSVSSDDVYVSSVEHRLRTFHRKPPEHFSETGPLRSLLDKCANIKRIEDEGWSVFLDFMFNMSLEGFPLTPPVRNSLHIWAIAAKLLRKTGTAALVRVSVASHPYVARRDVPLVMPPDTLTASGVELDEAVRIYTAAALTAVRSLHKDFVPPVHTMKTVEFARALEMMSALSPAEVSSEVMLGEAQPEMQEFLSEIISNAPSIILGKSRPKIWFRAPGLVSQLLKLVRSTDPYVVINFLCVRLMVQISPFIPPSKALADFYATLAYGKFRTDVPRWQLCLRAAETALLPLFYRSLLTAHDFQHESTAFRFTRLVRDIADGFLTGVENSLLFDEKAKAAIRMIVSETNFEVLAPASVKQRRLFARYLSQLPVSTASAFEAYVVLHERTFMETLAHGSSRRWTRSAFSTACWYERNPKTIYVPALVFNVTLPAREEPKQLSRAAPRVASCIFDALLSEASSVHGDSWLNKQTRSRLRNISSCFGVHKSHPSMALLRDVLSTQFAFGIYERSIKQYYNNSLSLRLARGKIMTSEQLFFVYLMLQRCEKKGAIDTLSRGSAHDMNVVLSNDQNFAAAFNCSPGSPMNLEKKCWV